MPCLLKRNFSWIQETLRCSLSQDSELNYRNVMKVYDKTVVREIASSQIAKALFFLSILQYGKRIEYKFYCYLSL